MDIFDLLKADYATMNSYLLSLWDESIDTKTSATGARLLKEMTTVGFMNIVYLQKCFQNAIFSTCTDRNVCVKKARSEKGFKALPISSAYAILTFTIPAPL